MRTEREVKEMISAKKHEEPEKVKCYGEGLHDGWINALRWFVGD